MQTKLNINPQTYKGITFRLIKRNYSGCNAKRFTLNETNQNVWIPNKHLTDDGTLIVGENIDYVFRRSQRQLELAGYRGAIVGVKRKSV